MRRRVASPVPPFDVVPRYVVEAAKRAFAMRDRAHARAVGRFAGFESIGLPLYGSRRA